MVLPDLDTSASSYTQAPVLPAISWEALKLPELGELEAPGPIWPITLALTLLWLASNAWFVRRYAAEGGTAG